jgi:NAD(P)-dependent dehydrogenase (short-subunit alcohol dehydrogenase family)
MTELAGKVAVVTGGTRGIGRATAELLAAAGASVAICARNTEDLREAVQDIETRFGVEALGGPADILDMASIQRFMDDVAAQFARIDMLVNNAGGSSQRAAKVPHQVQVTDGYSEDLPSRFENISDKEIMKAFDQKVLGMVRVTQAALPLLRQGRDAAIVNVASTKGLQPPVRVVTSGMAWAAVFNFSKSLSFELAPASIRVNVLCVDRALTAQTEDSRASWAPDKSMQEFLVERSRGIPMRRVAEAAEVAQAILFLATPRSSYITGQCLSIDGGGLRSF